MKTLLFTLVIPIFILVSFIFPLWRIYSSRQAQKLNGELAKKEYIKSHARIRIIIDLILCGISLLTIFLLKKYI